MNRALAVTALAAAILPGWSQPAGANILDNRPYTTLPDCPGVRQYVGIVNDYRGKKRTLDSVQGLIDRLVALGDAYHECASSLGASHIVDPETAAPGQHRIAAEAALIYYDALRQYATIIDLVPKAKRNDAKIVGFFVALGHTAVVNAKYVLDRSDDDADKTHAQQVVTDVGGFARKYYPKKYDEIVELKPEDIRPH